MGDQCSKTAKGSSGPLPPPPPPPPPPRRRTTPPSASASAADASTSCGLRQQGNAKYASAFHGASANTRSQSRAPVLRIGDAKEALRLYQVQHLNTTPYHTTPPHPTHPHATPHHANKHHTTPQHATHRSTSSPPTTPRHKPQTTNHTTLTALPRSSPPTLPTMRTSGVRRRRTSEWPRCA